VPLTFIGEALGAFGVGGSAEVVLAATSFNTVYRVTTEGVRYALRVSPSERIHPPGTEQVESDWMRALRVSGRVRVPQMLSTLEGKPVAVVREASQGDLTCSLFEWLDGPNLAAVMTPRAAAGLGGLAATLHDLSAPHPLPQSPPLVADRVLYWEVEDRLAQVALGGRLDEALDEAEAALEQVWASGFPQLIHGDLTPANVIVHDGRPCPIDFQDLVWGYPVQDIAFSLSSLGRFPEPETLRRAFREGYVKHRPWPNNADAVIPGLLVGRILHQMNLSLAHPRPGLDAALDRMSRGILDILIRRDRPRSEAAPDSRSSSPRFRGRPCSLGSIAERP
jgi:Ser/Thr protein kinase RdoA (MazF antagonist)